MKLKLFIFTIICFFSMSLSAQKFYNNEFIIPFVENLTKSSTFKALTDSVITESYNLQTGDWEIANRKITYCDPEWNVLHTIDFVRLGDSDIWVPSVKRQYLDPFYYYFRWDQNSSDWKDSLKVEYLDDGTISNLWNQAEGGWELYRKAEDEYDNSWNYRGGTFYFWDKSENTWKKYARTQITFSGSTKIQYDDLWNPSTSQWDSDEKSEFFEDDDFDLELINHYTWNESEREWVIVKKDEYSLSDALDFYGYIYQTITSVMENGEWKLFSRRTSYLCKHELTGIHLREKSLLKIYPNPFNDYLNISMLSHTKPSQIEIIDISGKVVFHKEISGSSNIPTSDLIPGLYFYRIQSEGKIYVGKLVKRR